LNLFYFIFFCFQFRAEFFHYKSSVKKTGVSIPGLDFPFTVDPGEG